MKVGGTVISTRHPFTARHRWPEQSMVLAALGLALCAGGCQNISRSLVPSAVGRQPQPQAAARGAKTEAEWRTEAEKLASRYREKPDDAATRARLCAGAARQRTAHPGGVGTAAGIFNHPRNTAVLGAYGRALSDVGNLEQALEVLNRAHTPGAAGLAHPFGAGRGARPARPSRRGAAHYASALKIKPDDPGVLSNLGLSYALAKDLKNAEATLRRAAALGGSRPAGAAKSRFGGRPRRAASPKPKASPAPTCRPRRRPPTSRSCAGCSPSRTISRPSRSGRSSASAAGT